MNGNLYKQTRVAMVFALCRVILFHVVYMFLLDSHVDDFTVHNKCLTTKLPTQGYRYHKLRKVVSKFYRRHH